MCRLEYRFIVSGSQDCETAICPEDFGRDFGIAFLYYRILLLEPKQLFESQKTKTEYTMKPDHAVMVTML